MRNIIGQRSVRGVVSGALVLLLMGCGVAELEAECRRKPVTDDMLRCLREVRGATRDYDAQRERASKAVASETTRGAQGDIRKPERLGCFKREATGETVCPN